MLYLPFWEGVGTFAEDISPYRNHGAITGATWVDGVIGKALSFNGISDYVKVTNTPSLAVGTGFAMSAWVKPTSFAALGFIFGKRNGPDTDQMYVLSYPSGGSTTDIECRFAAEGSYYDISPLPHITLNEWNHIVFVKDGLFTRCYVNSIVSANKAISGSLINSTDYYIGIQNASIYPFAGIVDEVYFVNRAPTPSEVWEAYYRGARKNY